MIRNQKHANDWSKLEGRRSMKHRMRLVFLVIVVVVMLVSMMLAGCKKNTGDAKESSNTELSLSAEEKAENGDSEQNNDAQVDGASEEDVKPQGHTWREVAAYKNYVMLNGSVKLTTVEVTPDNFHVYIDGRKVTVLSAEVYYDYSIKLQLEEQIAHGQEIYISYSGGKIINEENLEVLAFQDLGVTNQTETRMWPTRTWDLAAAGLTSVGGFCVADDGSFYITDPKAGLIYHLDSENQVLAKWGSLGEDEDAFGASGPGDIEVLGSVIAIVDQDKERVVLMDTNGIFLQTVGEPTTKDKFPTYSSEGYSNTQVLDYGYFYHPSQLSEANIFSNAMDIFDQRGVRQTFGIDGNKATFADRGTYIYEDSVIKDPATAAIEQGIKGNIVLDPNGYGLMDVTSRGFEHISIFNYPAYGSAWGSYVLPIDAKKVRDQSAVVVLDAGNCRLSILEGLNGLWRDSVGGVGTGGEQFLDPMAMDYLGTQLFVLDAGDLKIKGFMLQGPTMTMSTAKAIKVDDTKASPYVYFDNNQSAIIKEMGLVYAAHPYPTLEDSSLVLAQDFKEGRVEISGLTPGTQYYARAYVSLENGVAYSYQTDFVTTKGDLPPVRLLIEEAPDVFDESQTAVVKILVEGDSKTISESGFEVANNMAFRHSSLVQGDQNEGHFSGNISNENGKAIFVRAYAKISDSIVYSRIHCIQSLGDPQMIISVPMSQEYGVVYGDNENPTIEDQKLVGTLQDNRLEFKVTMENIASDQVIYYRGYIVTDTGTYYGNGGMLTATFNN